MSNNIKVSATRLSSFLACKLKYWYGYCKKLPKVDNPSFRLGTSVHESLEFAGKLWLEKGDGTKSFTAAETKKILSFYDQVAVREGLVDFGIHLEGRELVASRLKKFLSGRKLISLETKFGFYGKSNYIETKDGVPLMGAIDKVEAYDKDTLLIIDYKTSKTAPTGDQLRNDIQLSIYDYVARQLWPGYKRVILALDLLKSDIVYTYRTEEEREYFEDYLSVVYKAMVNFTEKEANPSINMFCPWCDFRDYCHAYEVACKKSEYEFMPVMNLNDDELISEWHSVKNTKKILEMREKELSMIITEKIKKDSKNIVTGEEEVYIRQNSRVTYDLETIHKYVPAEDFPSLVNANKKAVDNYVDINPEVKGPILSAAMTNYTSPFLATRKIKNNTNKADAM